MPALQCLIVPTAAAGAWPISFGARGGEVDLAAGAAYARQGIYYDAEGRRIAVNTMQGELMDADSYDLCAKAGWTPAQGQRQQLSVNRYNRQGDGAYVSRPGDYLRGRPATSIKGVSRGEPARNRSDSVSLDYSAGLAGGDLLAQLFWVDFKALSGGSLFRNFYGTDPNSTWLDQSQNVSQKKAGKILLVARRRGRPAAALHLWS